MSDNITKRVGLGTAYGFAKAGGYEGTVAEFTELLGNIAIDLARIENLSVTVTTLPAGSQATASLNGSVLSLGIPKGDKGDKGNTGETGAPAGFGTVSATVDSSVGTPSVEVTASGADTAKNFAFAFHNLKGQKGDKGDTGDVSQAQLDAAVSDLKSKLNDSQLIDYVQFNSANDGSYISSSGGVGSSDAFSRTDPFVLKKGCKLAFKCRGYAGSVAVIATLNSNSTYTALVVDDGSTEVKEYTYTADYDITLVLSYRIASEHEGIIIYEVQTNVNEIKSDIEAYGLNYSVDFSQMVSGYVNSIGNLISSDLFVHIPPIMLIAGETITVTARGYLTDVAIISEYEGGNVYNPLVLSVDSTVREYSYTATKNTNIVISFNKNYTHIANASVNVRDAIIGVDSEHDALYYGGLFPRLAVIGDSLSSGELVINGTAEDVYGDSWLSFLAKRINASARTHYSIGGLTAKGWIETYMTKMQSDNPFNAYFIALGTNDNYTQEYSLGTINDVAGTNTFVGYYKQIIESVRTKAPNAVIFCVSLYNNGEAHHRYSDMISDISDLYNNCFYVDFINNSVIYTSTNRVWSASAHFTTLGYNYVSTVIYKLICKIVDENKEYFKWFGKYNSVGTQFND